MFDQLNVHTTKRDGLLFSFVNADEFEIIYDDIFLKKDYAFDSGSPNPRILDCGSHIGISVLFFKSLYPGAHIVAFEPHPENFAILQHNIRQNNLDGVWLINAAVDSKAGYIDFFINQDINNWWTMSGSVKKDKVIVNSKPTAITQTGLTLSSFITSSVDLIKLDVQGVEQAILEEIQPVLSHATQLKLEYHGRSENPQNALANIIAILDKEGFSLCVTQAGQEVALREAIDKDLHWVIVHAKK